MRACRLLWALPALLLVAAAAARAQDAAPPTGPVPPTPAPDADALRRELAAAYHAAPLILVAYEVRKSVRGVWNEPTTRFEAYREGAVSAAWIEADQSLLVMGPDGGRVVVAGKVAIHFAGAEAVDAAEDAFNASLQRLARAWGRSLPSIPPYKAGLRIAFARAEEAGQFEVGMAAVRDPPSGAPPWLLLEDLRDAVATIVDGGAAVRFERKDEARVVRRADGMPDLWVLDRPDDQVQAELRRVESLRSRDAWASVVSEAQVLDPAGAKAVTFSEVLRAGGVRWEIRCLQDALALLSSSWPAWNGDATRRSAVEAELRAAWKEARRVLGLPAEPSAEDREALESALHEGLAASRSPAPSK